MLYKYIHRIHNNSIVCIIGDVNIVNSSDDDNI